MTDALGVWLACYLGSVFTSALWKAWGVGFCLPLEDIRAIFSSYICQGDLPYERFRWDFTCHKCKSEKGIFVSRRFLGMLIILCKRDERLCNGRQVKLHVTSDFRRQNPAIFHTRWWVLTCFETFVIDIYSFPVRVKAEWFLADGSGWEETNFYIWEVLAVCVRGR